MLERGAESLIHGIVAGSVLLALFALWRLEEPRQRVAFELTVLSVAALAAPSYLLLAPERAAETFREQSALFVSLRFSGFALLGSDARTVALLLLVALGLLLYLRDLLAMLHEPWRTRAPHELPASAELEGEVRDTAERLALRRPPRVRVVLSPQPALFCSGLLRPQVVVSNGLLERLNKAERRAALAHEMAHLAARDPLLGWLLLVVRSALFFNPAVQLIARALVFDLERRADDRAARATGEPLELAAALVKTHRHARSWLEAGAVPGLDGAIAMIEGFRARAVELRCRRLMAPAPSPLRLPGLHVASTAFGLLALLYFVV